VVVVVVVVMVVVVLTIDFVHLRDVSVVANEAP
jgi:hypothetical protein